MNESEPEQTLRKAGRQRSARSHQAILEATLTLFAEVGLQGLSIEAIAERAGVGKTTIYRRWSSKEDIIKDALDLLHTDSPIPEKMDNIRSVLLYVAKESQELFKRNPLMENLAVKLLAEFKSSPGIYRAFFDKVASPRIQQFRQFIERAQERRELRPDLDVALILYLLYISLVYGNILIELIDPDAQQAYEPDATVDALLRGIGT